MSAGNIKKLGKMMLLSVFMINISMAFAEVSITETKSLQPNLNRQLAKSQMIDLNSDKTLTEAEFVQQLGRYDYLILGEYHDSKAQHQLALWLLKALHDQRPQASLLLEMLRVDQQPMADEVMQTAVTDLSELKQSLKWQSSWDWDLYGKIVQHPVKHHYELVATNLSKAEVSSLMQKNSNTSATDTLEGRLSTSADIKSIIKNSIIANHDLNDATAEDMVMIDRMVEVQQHRDRRMAEKMLAAATPSLLLTGNVHARKNVGVPMHLADLQQHQADKKQAVVVMMVRDIQDLAKNDADYAWIIDDQDKDGKDK